ncbi:Glycosyltransferase involved in cell wall bisynthesis [Hymenobacter daecheongensis DSM 21074]|uniref:Glycosyltransferase involved in cell wall bisynthesis n=1 Tax=Hymenobacter daecheongensis DSM 21074 TaxID=1121955 RepID=A0A1M6KJG3_9BACT|nr:glycosyltransferase family 4 protein [Hymenobacter daecheongensis]SHJ59112.1 Glycosyltransferase involved in cell wall bisynthesis [Hymenobacter daecheongensis DSM 21074]
MNVLLSAYACNPAQGGECGNGFHWTWEMARRGHHVWCLTTPYGLAGITAFLAKHAEDPAARRVHFTYLDGPPWVRFLYRWQFGVYLHYMVWQYTAWRTAQKMDRAIGFDLVHHATYSSLKMGSWLWRLGKPLVYGPVGGAQKAPIAFRRYLPDWFRTETLRSAFTWVLTTLDINLHQNLRHATLVLASNDESAALARRLGARRVELFLDTGLPEAFQAATFPERVPQPVLKLLWVGRLFPNKALPLVLDALSQTDPRVQFHLTVLGDGPMRDLVPGWIAQYGLQDRVTWRGSVPWVQVHAAMLSHDVFLFGSLRDSFASQFMEAMATGLPIITLNHQGARTFIPNAAAIKVPAEQPDEATAAMARAVEYVYDHPAERLAMGRAGYDFAMAQTWPQRMDRLLTMLRELGLDTAPAASHAPDPGLLPEHRRPVAPVLAQ